MLSVWIIMSAVSQDKCFPVQGDLEKVQEFGKFATVDRMKSIDSNRYGFIPGKITFDDAVDNVCNGCSVMFFFSLRCVN